MTNSKNKTDKSDTEKLAEFFILLYEIDQRLRKEAYEKRMRKRRYKN